MRQAIAKIPPGTYRGEVETDGFDHPITLRCAITGKSDEIHVDCEGSSLQQEHGINCTKRWSFAEVAHACICVAHPSSPVNGATLKRITYSVPEGTVINATYPAALGARALVAMYLQGMIFRTLAQAVPDRVIAETGTPPHLSAYMGLGNGGRRYVDIMFLNGGLGARPTMDGVSSIGWPANIAGIPVEVTENEKPLLFLAKELVTNSGGAGRQRGAWRRISRSDRRRGSRSRSASASTASPIPRSGFSAASPAARQPSPSMASPSTPKRRSPLQWGTSMPSAAPEAPATAIRTSARRRLSCATSRAATSLAGVARNDYGVALNAAGDAVDAAATKRLRGGR